MKKHIFFVLTAGLTALAITSASYADTVNPEDFEWLRAAYWDIRYPTGWTSGALRNSFESAGYEILDADQLKTWMDARIADGKPSVVVFCKDIAPDTVAESMSSSCTLRQYLNAGGKIVWYADIPMYYQGHSDGSRTEWYSDGSYYILGFYADSGLWDSEDQVTFTSEGANWGLTQTWQSWRSTSTSGLRVLAEDDSGYATAWVKHYVPDDRYHGFVRLYDRPGEPAFNDVRRVAEYCPFRAKNPNPADGDVIVTLDPNITLGWTPGEGALSHNVYFGADFDGVKDANTADANFYMGNFDVNSYDPCALEFYKTYYWRIDEVNDSNTTWKGAVWSFMIASSPYDWRDQANERIELYRKGNFRITAVSPYGSKPPIADVNVQVSQIKHHFAFGTCIDYSRLLDNAIYRDFILDHFEWAVCENEMKWSSNESSRDNENYYRADYIANWCASNGIIMRGHTVVWETGAQTPSWVSSLDCETYPTPSEMLEEIDERFNSVVGRYAGQIVQWDINNEMLSGNMFDCLGEAGRAHMFTLADSIDTNCLMMMNEFYGNSFGGYDGYPYVSRANSLITLGAPVEGLGIQAHLDSPFQPENYYNNVLQELAVLGLPIVATEFDTDATNATQVADDLENFYRICFSHPDVKGIIMWGFDQGSWRWQGIVNSTTGVLNAAGVRYETLMDEWTTNDSSFTDSNGNADFRGFYGKYQIALTSQGADLMALATIDIIPGGPNEFTIELSPRPAAPNSLEATTVSENILLDWNDNNESTLAGYNIYRSQTSGSGYIKINGSVVSNSNYTDDTVIVGGITYYYVVTAIDIFSRESEYSNEDFATTPPTPPTGLVSTAGNSTVSLDWNDNIEEDVNGYNVYRSQTSGSGYVKVNESLLSDSNYIDNTVMNETIYYYVVTAVDIYSNESGYSTEVPARPSKNPTTIYNFSGITASNIEYNAFSCDVDTFPFEGSSDNVNSKVEATDKQYVDISANNTAEWATADAGFLDEIFLWVEMKINETPSDINRIDLTFNGNTSNTSESGATTHKIYVMKAGADWTQNNSWVQVGSEMIIEPGVDTTMTRSITSDFSTYIDDADGKIIWAVYETTSSEFMNINYLETAVTGSGDTDPPAAPNGLVATADNNMVSLDWNNNNETDLAGYNVYRSEYSSGGYDKINTSLLNDSNYVDNDVNNFTPYYYVVTAIDTSNNSSGYSDEVSATPDIYQDCPEVQAGGDGLVSDLTDDCYVDLDDLDIIVEYWLDDDCETSDDCQGADFVPVDGDVDLEDFGDFAVDWLLCNNPGVSGCIRNWWPAE